MTGMPPSPRPGHVPVLLNEVLAALAPRRGALYVDATFGAGGYARAVLDAAPCTVVAIDRDPEAVARAHVLGGEVGDRLQVVEGRFGDLESDLAARGINRIDGGVMLDLGLSSPQLASAGRGFSFRLDGPLDMRMGRQGTTAADVVNTADEGELADILYRFGEERASRRVAAAIVAARQRAPLTRTGELAEVVRKMGGIQGIAGELYEALNSMEESHRGVADCLKMIQARLLVAMMQAYRDEVGLVQFKLELGAA